MEVKRESQRFVYLLRRYDGGLDFSGSSRY